MRHVVIGGRLVVRDRAPTTANLPRLGREAEAARERLGQANAQVQALVEKRSVVVASLYPGLAIALHRVRRGSRE